MPETMPELAKIDLDDADDMKFTVSGYPDVHINQGGVQD
jgi:hypothetical protein